MAVTDAALKLLLTDYRAARQAIDADKVTLDTAELALAQALGAGTEVVVRINVNLSVRIRVNPDGAHVVVDPLRSVV